MQRKLETKLRYAKEEKAIYQAAGQDDLVREVTEKMRILGNKYKEVSDKAGLPTRAERMRVYKADARKGWKRKTVNEPPKVIPKEEPVKEIVFVPAKSIREAQEFGRTYSNAGVFVVKDVKLDIVNGFNEAAYNVLKRYGRKLKISGIEPVKKADTRYHQAAYDPTTGVMKLKNSGMATYEKNAEKFFANGWNASRDKYGTFYHEIGHAIWEDLPSDARAEIREIYADTKHDAYLKWMEKGGGSSGLGQADVFGKELSRYAIENEQEFFSEAFSQIMSGRARPVSRKVSEVLNRKYRHAVEIPAKSGIIESGIEYKMKLPEEKFTGYALNPEKAADKAEAFERALGYTLENYEDLVKNIIESVDETRFVEKGDSGYGMRYEYIVELTGPNGKKANVLTAWIQDGEEKRLTSVYVTKKKVTE